MTPDTGKEATLLGGTNNEADLLEAASSDGDAFATFYRLYERSLLVYPNRRQRARSGCRLVGERCVLGSGRYAQRDGDALVFRFRPV
jgi:hypothetical protein